MGLLQRVNPEDRIGFAEPDLSGEAKLEIRRVLGKLVLTIGDLGHTLSPEQERQFWDCVKELDDNL